MKVEMERGKSFVAARKYEILLVSFLLLIFGNTFCNVYFFGNDLFICQNMLVGFLVSFDKKKIRNIIGGLNIVHFILAILSLRFAYIDEKSLKGIIFLAYFVVISIEVYKEIFTAITVSREMVSAVLCGFILLCLIATFLFFEVEVHNHHSFSHLGEGRERLLNLNYFSFVTILTTGYGDIVPLSLMAKRAVMFMGLAGHFYTVFITGIVIGKYINGNNGKSFKAAIVKANEAERKALLSEN